MGVWDSHRARLEAMGGTQREIVKRRAISAISTGLSSSLSQHTALVNGISQELAIINTDVRTAKTIHSFQSELFSGDYVVWKDVHWLITDVDLNNELYSSGAMMQCNHFLEWINEAGSIVGRWCHVSDGTKYMAGETYSSYNGNNMVLGDSRITVILPRDKETVRLTRTYRFLIDDPDSISILSYRLTKPFKVGDVYDGHGVMGFILSEANLEPDDNEERHIADYYKYFPRAQERTQDKKPMEDEQLEMPPYEPPSAQRKKVWY